MLIVKVGGGATINLDGIVEDLAQLDQPFVVVHGANALRDEIASQLNKPRQTITSVKGIDSVFSDEDAIDVILMSYAGLRNKRLVEALQIRRINAVGLSGLDGRLVQGKRNSGIRVKQGSKTLLKRDFSGKPQSVNQTLLTLLLDNGFVPVLTIPIVDENGFAINSENDDIVNELQSALNASLIVQLIEAPGFLDDASDEASMVAKLTQAELISREQQVSGRMKRKMMALTRLFERGAARVIISDGRTDHPLRDALEGAGTHIG